MLEGVQWVTISERITDASITNTNVKLVKNKYFYLLVRNTNFFIVWEARQFFRTFNNNIKNRLKL